jgi:hypothetical protein
MNDWLRLINRETERTSIKLQVAELAGGYIEMPAVLSNRERSELFMNDPSQI